MNPTNPFHIAVLTSRRPDIDEKSAIRALQEGKLKVFQKFYDAYFPSLCIFAERYVGNPDDATDMVQDAFVALWQSRGEFASEAQLRSFLYVAVRSRSLNLLKQRAVRAGKAGDIIRELTESEEAEAVISSDVARQVMGLLDELPQECRRVLRLSIEGRSYKEIAETMNVTVSTVRNHRVRAVKKLKALAARNNIELLLMVRPFL